MAQGEENEKRKKYLAKYREEHREQRRIEGAKWREDNPAYFQRYYQHHRDTIRRRSQKRYIENKDECLAQTRYYKLSAESKAAKMAYQKRMRSLYPQVYRARKILGKAVKAGTVIRGKCEVCGASRVEAHHDSYERGKELEVRWLCNYHHRLIEGKILVPKSDISHKADIPT